MIERTLSSLFDQTAFSNSLGDHVAWEVIVVPNGCTDDTSNKASLALAELVESNSLINVAWSVRDISDAGKSNAWNRFVHEFSSPEADLILMIDADIVFGEKETIENCVAALLGESHAVVVVDQPLKDAVLKPRKTLWEQLTVAASYASGGGAPAIAGSFYCARASALREIWMPAGLVAEDGFLRAMIVTNCFRKPVDESRIIRAPHASHFFETLTSLRAVFRHEVRLTIGTALNCYLTWDLLFFATDPEGPGAGVLIRNRISHDPGWFPALIDNAIFNRGWWVLPRGMLFRRFSSARRNQNVGNLKWLMIAISGFIFDIPVFVVANRKLKRGKTIGYW